MIGQHPAQILGLALMRGLVTCDDLGRAMASWAGEGAAELLLRLDAMGILDMGQQGMLAEEVSSPEASGGRAAVAWQTSSVESRAKQFKTATMLPSWGPYRNLRFIGEGGMGRIFQAYDPSLRRVVALKILRGDSPELVMRFLLEAQNQAAVEHPNICRVYEVGEWQGYSFIAMQFIVGEGLDLLAPRLTIQQKVGIMRTVAEAIHAAHGQGLIHRDIKPANIMVEREANGRLRPYVLDFGLSRGPDASGFTVTGLVLGTTYYMAPEQARGDNRLLDRRTDVYSLGATFYRTLCGRPPFADSAETEEINHTQYSEPISLRRMMPSLPRDLCTIAQKCMERDPADRYPTAEAMAEDLRRFQEGEPILAATPSLAYRSLKFIRKRKSQFFLASTALGAMLIFGGMAVSARLRAEEQVQLAQQLALEAAGLESQIRYVHRLPLHNIRSDQRQIRKQVDAIRMRGANPGQAAKGPIAYALGRACLAGDDPELAKVHLEEAWERGYRKPEVAYLLALSIIRLHRSQLGDRKIWVPKLLAALKASQGATTESPLFIQAQLAFYESRFDRATELAEQAMVETPWLYEARALQAEIHLARAEDLQEPSRVIQELEMASDDLRTAQSMAPCDPSLRELECRRWEQELAWRRTQGLELSSTRRALLNAGEVKAMLCPS
ncbi:MAG: hypothetical protein H6Q00_2740 [Holophagaceae bacterium]|nr:hypothetical protein [Holophagaceae bacterium]